MKLYFRKPEQKAFIRYQTNAGVYLSDISFLRFRWFQQNVNFAGGHINNYFLLWVYPISFHVFRSIYKIELTSRECLFPSIGSTNPVYVLGGDAITLYVLIAPIDLMRSLSIPVQIHNVQTNNNRFFCECEGNSKVFESL